MCPVLSRSSIEATERQSHQHHRMNLKVPSKKVAMQKPGIPPARIPEVAKRGRAGMMSTVVHVVGVVLASFATGASRVLFHCITLYCTEHSLQDGMLFLVIKDSFYLLQELQWLVHQCLCLFERSVEDNSYQHRSSILLEKGGSSIVFFPSSLAVNALWHGPNNDISSEKAVNSTIG